MSPSKLKEILRLHSNWIKNPKYTHLKADLYRENLFEADLNGSMLKEANLGRANLNKAKLNGADLSGADLRSATLCISDLRGANLRGADLRFTSLGESDLQGADLSGADLYMADLRGAKFTIELMDSINLGSTIYQPHQFSFLALNRTFLNQVQKFQRKMIG